MGHHRSKRSRNALGTRAVPSSRSGRVQLGIERLEDRRLLTDFDVLVFSRTTGGFRHSSIEEGVAAIEELGQQNDFSVTWTEDESIFSTDAGLAPFEAIVFLNTSGNPFFGDQRTVFQNYIRNGGGFVGVHAATDTFKTWDWYTELVGAVFDNHPAQQNATVVVTDRNSPSTELLPAEFDLFEEWYNFKANPQGDVHVLAELKPGTLSGSDHGVDHPVSWRHSFEGGRSWYTSMGHRAETYENPNFLKHLLGGIHYAAGQELTDLGATDNENWRKVVLEDSVSNPMSLDVANDGRVFFIELTGRVRMWDPQTESTTTVLSLGDSIYFQGEDGMLGIALDPDFDENNWIYLYYTPDSGGDPEQHVQRLSRMTLVGDRLFTSSEEVLLEFPANPSCCHSAGSLQFGPDGTLYLSTGDDVTPTGSAGFAPIDERPGREAFDAQATAANTNDLRGKILRIKPEPDGTYSIPEGNLFPADGSAGRPEIYVMGVRNPFRISVDQRNGTLYWGDVGPDATIGGPRGPIGVDEINRTEKPGNFGWPYVLGPNSPYSDYDFETGEINGIFSPTNPVNESPNNTGLVELPTSQPAWLYYTPTTSFLYPEFGSGGRTAAAGPTYYYDADLRSDYKLPEYYNNALFVYDWSRSRIWEIKTTVDDEDPLIQPFLPQMDFRRPIEMELGPDGALYVLEWGTNGGGGNSDAKLVRLEYHGNLPKVLGDYNGDRLTNDADLQIWQAEQGVVGESPADGNRDGYVNDADLLIWQAGVDATPQPGTPHADYNGDGVVNIADYTTWRDSLGATGAGLPADGNDSGEVNNADYREWFRTFGDVTIPIGDYNGNGVADIADYTVWRDNLGFVGDGNPADGNQDSTVDGVDLAIWQIALLTNASSSATTQPARATAFEEDRTDADALLIGQPDAADDAATVDAAFDSLSEDSPRDLAAVDREAPRDESGRQGRGRIRGRLIERVQNLR